MRDYLEKFLISVAQAFQPVPRKQVISAQPGKAVPPKEAGTEARPTSLFRLDVMDQRPVKELLIL
jgi:hypothetical protein